MIENGQSMLFDRLPDQKLSDEVLEEARLIGTRLSINFRWAFILLATVLLTIQLLVGYTEMSKHGFTLIVVYFMSNLFFWYAAYQKYNPPHLGYIGGTIDIAIISFHIYGMTIFFDPAAATATIFLIPIIFMIYTFRLNRILLLYLIIIAAIGFNLIYFVQYSQTQELLSANISLSPIAHIFKTAYISFIGLLCMYMQKSIIRFIEKQLTEAAYKNRLDADNKLQETQSLVKNLTSNLPGAVSRCIYDEYFTAKYYSEKIFDISGYRAENLIDNKNLRFVDIIYHEDLKTVREQVRENVKNNKPYSLEFRIVKKNGQIIWIQENGRPVYDEANKVLYLDGITMEITDKKNAEQALIEAKLELERLNEQLEKTIEERTDKLTKANTQLLKLQKENLQSQFEVLKQQVNPHFLFNSLNVVTSLIKVDPDLAEAFTEKLSKVYRYVLENKEKDLITLATELDFIKSYAFLLDIRFSGKLFIEINVDEKYSENLVVPMVLQLLVENVVKHNSFSKKNPLKILLTVDNDYYLTMINNLQNRKTHMVSTGVGLVNISKRYSLLTDKEPVFDLTKEHFTARVPLIGKYHK